MKFVLLMFVSMFNMPGIYPMALGSADFDDEAACQAAGAKWVEVVKAVQRNADAKFTCAPKRATQ
jgi:hypothetical protein